MRSSASPFAVIHIDLDGYVDICRAHGWRFEGARDSIFETGLKNAFEFLTRHRIRASLFAIAQDLGNAAKKEYLCEAVTRGHEIASHSVTHRKLSRLASADKRKEIYESRMMIEQALGVPVRGFRAPGFDMDGGSLQLVESAGYEYDSSFFPGSAKARQLKSISVAPHACGDTGRLMELPMPAYSPLPLPFHASYSLVLGNWYFNAGIRRFRRTGAPLVLLFHLTDFADPVQDGILPNWKAKIYTLSFLSRAEKLRRCGEMLDFVREHYQIVSTAELVQHSQVVLGQPLRAGNLA